MIITGANQERERVLNVFTYCAEKVGYKPYIYNYGGLSYGHDFPVYFPTMPLDGTYLPKIPMKPLIILDALYRFDDEWIIYMDCDTEILDRFDEVEGDYDVGVTIHPKDFRGTNKQHTLYKHVTSFLNAGVIYFKNTEASKNFIRQWIWHLISSETGSDQHALTSLLRNNIPEAEWDYNNIYQFNGMKVKMFPTIIYNYTFLPEQDIEKAKVVHWIGEKRNLLISKYNK